MMKYLPVLLILILLCGCAAQAPAEQTLCEVPCTDPQEHSGLYDPDSTLEAETAGAIRCYPLGGDGDCGIYPLCDSKLLLITPGDDFCALSVLEGDSLIPTANAHLDYPLQPGDDTLLPCGNGISFYDSICRETVILNETLQEVSRIPAPDGMLGQPLLSRNGELLYYCTADAVRVLELSSGISRVLKQSTHTRQTLTGLWLGDTAVSCLIAEEAEFQTVLISAQTGATLYSCPGESDLSSANGQIYAAEHSAFLFGTPGAPLQMLMPASSREEIHFLAQSHSALSLYPSDGEETVLAYYNLTTGQREAVLTLSLVKQPRHFLSGPEGCVWFLGFDQRYGCNTLYLWDPQRSPTGDRTVYTGAHFTRENPDVESLAQCAAYARELEKCYGIEIRIYQEADDVQPPLYRLEYEYLAPPLYRSLEQLEVCLQQYPGEMLQTVVRRFDGLTVCLVRSIRGSPDHGSLERTDGLQFWDGHHAYIALSVGDSTQGAFYHQFCHLMDTIVLNESSAYDTWQSLNPSGFQYDYSYSKNRDRNSTAYLQGATRSFVDMFSMSFPKEDRAKIMEYAMLPDQAALFQSRTMQAKLRQLCLGIREAFALEKSPEIFPWEQYLDVPLAHTK